MSATHNTRSLLILGRSLLRRSERASDLANVTTTTMKIMMFGFAKTLYRLSCTFRPDGQGSTAVTMIGQAQQNVRDELARLGSG